MVREHYSNVATALYGCPEEDSGEPRDYGQARNDGRDDETSPRIPRENRAKATTPAKTTAQIGNDTLRLIVLQMRSLVHGLIRMMHLDGLQQRESPRCAMNHLIASVH